MTLDPMRRRELSDAEHEASARRLLVVIVLLVVAAVAWLARDYLAAFVM